MNHFNDGDFVPDPSSIGLRRLIMPRPNDHWWLGDAQTICELGLINLDNKPLRLISCDQGRILAL